MFPVTNSPQQNALPQNLDVLSATQALLAQHGAALETERGRQRVSFDDLTRQVERTLNDLRQENTQLRTEQLVAKERERALKQENTFLKERSELIEQMLQEQYHGSIEELLKPLEKPPTLLYTCGCMGCSPPDEFYSRNPFTIFRYSFKHCKAPEPCTEQYNQELTLYKIQETYIRLKNQYQSNTVKPS